VHLDAQEYAKAQDLYYELCGWEKTSGNPGKSKLSELSLDWLAEQLGY
jgi:aldehyde:ferredoxin oxidoreductase